MWIIEHKDKKTAEWVPSQINGIEESHWDSDAIDLLRSREQDPRLTPHEFSWCADKEEGC
jgi:hypothetical protein